ncbi:hypothetical protein [Dickeya phage Sucellus]|nr:hypothetical protein [Dickeya phage Sucellus]
MLQKPPESLIVRCDDIPPLVADSNNGASGGKVLEYLAMIKYKYYYCKARNDSLIDWVNKSTL